MGVMSELCLWKPVCKILKAVAWVTVAPMPAAFFFFFASSDSSHQVGLRSPFTFTGEGTQCQLAGGSAGPAVGAWHLLLWEAAKGHMLGN